MATPNLPAGPAPVAPMDDEDVEMADETSSMISEVESQTTTSRDSESSDATSPTSTWRAVGVDPSTLQAALDASAVRKPIAQPPASSANSAPPPARPPPQRIPLNGVKTYVEWIPYWCDPEWNDEHYKFDEDGTATHWVEVHPLDKQRPALLPKDSLKNPTPYAKRFGIAPDQSNGRSRMSPSISTSRNVKLTQVQQTPTGMKDFITIEDVRTFLRGVNLNDIASSSDYLRSLLKFQTGNTEQMDAYLQLQDILEQDEALQQAALLNTTTDERIAHDGHSLDATNVKYNLNGPLHPLLRREMWMDTITRGDVKEEPRYLYNLHGNRGEWCAQDENVWTALQPAFQLVTRILNTDHPFFLALLNAKSRRKIDSSRLLWGATSAQSDHWVSFTAHFNPTRLAPTHPEQVGATHINKIDHYGYDLPRAAAQFLTKRLRLGFNSCVENWEKGMPFDQITWGTTDDACRNDPSAAGIEILLGVEMLWPLLTPEFTHKEKASCTIMIATTLLHELAHAANKALLQILDLGKVDNHDVSSPLFGVPVDLKKSLRHLGSALRSKNEPFYENEPVQECGFSFENALWGGRIDSAFSHSALFYAHHAMIPIAILLTNWPSRRKPHKEDETMLVNPPLPVDDISALLPTDAYTKFFDQTFWSSEFLKYGHQSLKMLPDTGQLTILRRGYTRTKDLRRVFGKARGDWLQIALRYLRGFGHGLLYCYCRELMSEKMEFVWVRKRFHHECKVWPVRNEVFDNILGKINNSTAELYRILQHVNSTVMEKEQRIARENDVISRAIQRGEMPQQQYLDMNSYIARLFNQVGRVFNVLIANYTELHHHLLNEIRCTQTLVVDYVRQKPSARVRLHDHYGGLLYTKIEETFEPVITDLLATLENIRREFMSTAALTEELDDDIERMRNYLRLDLNHLTKTKFYLSSDNVSIDKLFWTGELETIPRGRNKKISRVMKRMATKELLRADPLIRTLVETFLDVLNVKYTAVQAEENARSLKRVTERIKKDLQANDDRRAQAAGYPGWANPTPSRTPEQTGIWYNKPAEKSVPPWEAAPSPAPSAAARGLLFGKSNPITPTTTPPISPRTTATFAQYASKPSAFLQVPASQSVLRQHATGPDTDDVPAFNLNPADAGFGGGPPPQPGWGPFGTAWSDSRTVSAELHREGVSTPEFRNVFGQEVYLRQKAAEEAARREVQAKKTGYYP